MIHKNEVLKQIYLLKAYIPYTVHSYLREPTLNDREVIVPGMQIPTKEMT